MRLNRRCFLASIIASLVPAPVQVFTQRDVFTHGEEMLLYTGAAAGGRTWASHRLLISQIDYLTKTVKLEAKP